MMLWQSSLSFAISIRFVLRQFRSSSDNLYSTKKCWFRVLQSGRLGSKDYDGVLPLVIDLKLISSS